MGSILKEKRGAIIEWLGYGAGSRRKVVSSRLGFAMRRLENSLCQPSSLILIMGTFFESGKDKEAKGEG